MVSWIIIVLDILGKLKTAASLILSSHSSTKRLLRPTYDILDIKKKINEGTLGIGSRVKVIGRYSEFIPFIDLSTLLLTKVSDIIRKQISGKREIEELAMCAASSGAPLVGTCRLPRIEGFWPGAIYFPHEDDTSSKIALPLFFNDENSELLKAKTGDLVEVEAKISPLPSVLSEILHPDPIFLWEREDKTKIPIGLYIEKIKSIAKSKSPMLIDIWLLGHYEPPLKKSKWCPFHRSYIRYRLLEDGTPWLCPVATSSCVLRSVLKEEEEKEGQDLFTDLRMHVTTCYFFENIGNRFFRIGKGGVNLNDEDYEKAFELLKFPFIEDKKIIKEYYRKNKIYTLMGKRNLSIDFQYDQRNLIFPQGFQIT